MKKNGIYIIIFSICFLCYFQLKSENNIDIISQIQVEASDINVSTPRSTTINVNILSSTSSLCENFSIQIDAFPDITTIGIAWVENEYINFTPIKGFLGNVSIPYTLSCDGIESSAFLNIEVTRYSTPPNMIPQDTECVEEMPIGVEFNPSLKSSNSTYRLNGFSMPLVGDLNGDGKPEIICLGLDGSSGGSGLEAYARYIIIYNGQNGEPIIRFDLRTLGGTYGSTGQFKLRYQPRHNSPCHLAIADLDKDGLGEIVVCETGSLGRIYCLKPVINSETKEITNFTKMWDGNDNGTQYSFKYPYPGPDQNYFGEPMPYISDLNGDGIPEIIVYNKVYNGTTGQILLEMEELRYFRADFNYIYTSNDQATRSQYAYIGRRHGYNAEADDAIPVISIIDIDDDGIMEIVAGMKVYKPYINNLDGKDGNYIETPVIQGPTSVTLPYGTGSATRTYQLMDGYTIVADIDGDDYLDIIVQSNITQNWDDDYRGLIVVWDPRFPEEIKAASLFRGYSLTGMASIPFVGDINGRLDDITGTKKLPEICITTGVFYYSRNYDNYVSGIPFHPLSSDTLQTNSGYFNRSRGTETGQCEGHIVGLTYHGDENTPIHERLKLAWAMEHEDGSANTGVSMFDFDNDGIMELCYRDEKTVRVISPAMSTYIRKNITTGPIRFRYPNVKSYTGYEAPIIADVNMDGSADIITICYTESGTDRSYGFPFIFEYTSGSDKWAPAPPVWNQGIYFPLQINADLTIPTSPISTLTKYQNNNGDIIKPYNGSWIQQPIVKQGENYVPVVKQPDAIMSNIYVNVNNNITTIKLIIKNEGTATINSQTPIAFYKSTTNSSIDESTFITQVPLGKDIFPETLDSVSYTINDDLSNFLIWARITDNGTTFPVAGYNDCDTSNNSISINFCPNFYVNIKITPDTVICGDYGSVLLETVDYTIYSEDAIFQWYKDNQPISNANDYIYIATEPGVYKLFINDYNICDAFSDSINLIKDTINGIAQPQISSDPNTNNICGPEGIVILTLENPNDYSSGNYQWYKNLYPITSGTKTIYFANEAGNYQLRIINGQCMTFSDIITITNNTVDIPPPEIAANPSDATVINDIPVDLYLVNTSDYNNPSYNWYYNNTNLNNTNQSYSTTTIGEYRLFLKEEDCIFWSNRIEVKTDCITIPDFDVSNFTACKEEPINLKSTITNLTTNSIVRFFSSPSAEIEYTDTLISEGLLLTTTFYIWAYDTITNCKSEMKTMVVYIENIPSVMLSSENINICENDDFNLEFTFTGTSPWTVQYNDGTQNYSLDNITSNPYVYTLNPGITTTYKVISLEDAVCYNSNTRANITVNVKDYPSTEGLEINDFVWIGPKNGDSSTDNNWFNNANWRIFNGNNYDETSSIPNFSTDVYLRDPNSCIQSFEIVMNGGNAECNNLTIENPFSLSATSDTLNIYGDFINSGEFNHNSGTVIFSGTSGINIKSNYSTFYNVKFNKTLSKSNVPIFYLFDDFTVANSADFSTGIINTNSNRFIFEDIATSNTGNVNSFIDGITEKDGSTEFIFPTGDLTNRNIDGTIKEYQIWAPFKVTPSEKGVITVEYHFDNENLPTWWYHDSTHEYPLHHVSDREYWYLSADIPLTIFTLYWNNNNPCYIHDFCDTATNTFLSEYLTTAYWNGEKWISSGGSPLGDSENGSITSLSSRYYRNMYNSTYITFGATNEQLPLPVELLSFDAKCNNENIEIKWSTASETNCKYFILEKSYDLVNFEDIAIEQGSMFSNSIKEYSFIDNDYPQKNNYYKLSQLDYNGTFKTLKIANASCNINDKNTTVDVYPVPTDSEITIILTNYPDDIVYFDIYNELGKLVLKKMEYPTQTTQSKFKINLSNLSSSIYYLKTYSKNHNSTNKIILKSK